MPKIQRLELKEVRVEVTVSEHEVRVWACNKLGQCEFRLKASGQIFANMKATPADVIVRGE